MDLTNKILDFNSYRCTSDYSAYAKKDVNQIKQIQRIKT